MNTKEINKIHIKIEPLRNKIIHHPLFEVIKEPEDVQLFMEHHVYAVWDFMSLLKALQIQLTTTSLPWYPKGNGETRYLINEIVLGEESDIDFYGNRKSHYEMYLDAMNQAGCNTERVDNFAELMRKFCSLEFALETAQVPSSAADFVKNTFNTIKTGKAHLLAGAFTFGREDLIPDMFLSVVENLNNDFSEQFSLYKYYLERHIEVDGGLHGNLALKMVSELCGDDRSLWLSVQKVSYKSLQLRLALWDSIHKKIILKHDSKKDIKRSSFKILDN